MRLLLSSIKIASSLVLLCLVGCSKTWQWEAVEAQGKPTARHEAGLVAFEDKLYLLGGRRINPVDVFDPASGRWQELSKPPVEIHHFQAVVFGEAIYILGAMTGGWPEETPLERVLVYYPKEDRWEFSHQIPEHRQRGGAGAVVYQDKIYLVGGISEGHMRGHRAWLDEYDPKTGEWKTLPDAPHARDHFQAAVAGDRLYAFAGRRTSRATGEDMTLTVQHGNVFDFATQAWLPVTSAEEIPTQRAGTFVFSWNGEVMIGGGESSAHEHAHWEVEAYNTQSATWRDWPRLLRGRHGSGFATVGDYVYTISGAGNRGGGPELESIERLKLPSKKAPKVSQTTAPIPVHKRWHSITFNFEGPESSEQAQDNPFLNYRLSATFTKGDESFKLRGYYAADGDAAASGADSGRVWQLKFTPPSEGLWHYQATLERGDGIAISEAAGQPVALPNNSGQFEVIASDKESPDFRALGRLSVNNGYFYLPHSDQYWLKAGANSPENLLAFEGIDGTYRVADQARDGESKVDTQLHRFEAHLKDWRAGDPSFRNDTGRALFGAVNYLADSGMNAIYFLTMNIGGDGKDVWPYADPSDFSRFDVSKLAQWDQLFEHMQSKGIVLHIVTQETENERLFDDGNVGPQRRLYYQELIARFGHHPGLIWNLGEENGFAPWSPPAQDDAQRKAMIDFFAAHDPYDNPVLLHTHSEVSTRKPVLDPLLGYPGLDGLSFQADQRNEAAKVLHEWRERSLASGQEWLISMDEIGMWHTGANTDANDPGHASLRGDVLWGSLLSGAAGVEWYFGAQVPHNDLSSEDWRQRDELWRLTKHALDFFRQHTDWWAMQSCSEQISLAASYCAKIANETYIVYLPSGEQSVSLDLSEESGQYAVSWYNPRQGGELQTGALPTVMGGEAVSLEGAPDQEDWVILLKAQQQEPE